MVNTAVLSSAAVVAVAAAAAGISAVASAVAAASAVAGPRNRQYIFAQSVTPQPKQPAESGLGWCWLQAVRGGAARKTERLREMVGEAGQCGELMSLQVALPLDPTVLLNGIIPTSCSVYKSAMAPLRLTFRVAGKLPPCARFLPCAPVPHPRHPSLLPWAVPHPLRPSLLPWAVPHPLHPSLLPWACQSAAEFL